MPEHQWVKKIVTVHNRVFEVGMESQSGIVSRIYMNGCNVTVYIGARGGEKRISFDIRDIMRWKA